MGRNSALSEILSFPLQPLRGFFFLILLHEKLSDKTSLCSGGLERKETFYNKKSLREANRSVSDIALSPQRNRQEHKICQGGL